jgi:anti-anti-sigma factor
MALIAREMHPARVSETFVGQEVTISGRLDVTTVAEVRVALHDILDRGVGDLLVHLAQAEVHDASGLGVIVGVHHRARRVERRLVLVDVSARLDRLLRGSRLHRVLARSPGDEVVAVPGSGGTVAPATEMVTPFTGTVAPFSE